jgi:hypothetical protein
MTSTAIDALSLQRAIIHEAFGVMNFARFPGLSRLLTPLFKPPTGRLARLAADFDNRVASEGLPTAAEALLSGFVGKTEITGREYLPASGPLIIASNHPAAYDVFLIAATLPRDDLKIIASNITILHWLPAVLNHFIFISDDAYVRMAAVRASIRHLRAGGSLLIFPSGNVDPDPDVTPGAAEALQRWSPSMELYLRKVPQSQVVPTIVSGVLSPRWARSPITRLRKTAPDRQKVAEIFQVMQQLLFPGSLVLEPRLSFGRPVTAADLRDSGDSGRQLPQLIERGRQVLKEHTSADRE